MISAEAAYSRGDAVEKRRVLMQAWADWCFGRKSRRHLAVNRKTSPKQTFAQALRLLISAPGVWVLLLSELNMPNVRPREVNVLQMFRLH